MANYLAKMGESVPAFSAMCVANPFNLTTVVELCANKLFGLYNKAFTKNLVRKYNQHIDVLRGLESKLNIELDSVLRNMQTVKELDTLITCRQFGYASVEEYYEKSS